MGQVSALAPLGPIELLRREPRFRALWLSQVVSELGDWFQIVALLTLLPTGAGKAHVVGGYLALRLLPMVVLAPLTGFVADRFHRGRVMIVCDLLRAAIVLCYPLVLRADGSVNVPLLYVLSFTQEALSAFFEPARSAAIPQVVPTRGLLSANALGGATWSAMVALGAFFGGVATARLGRNAAYVIDAASFVLSAVFVLLARVPPLPAGEHHEAQGIREGVRYLRAHPAQLVAASLKGGWGLVGGIVVLFTAFADQIFTRNDPAAAATAIGVLYAGRGVGAFIGPFVARRFTGESIAGLCRALVWSFPVAALGYVGFALSPSASIAALALIVAHCGGSTVWVHSTQLLQLTVPNRLLGRVFAVELSILTTTMALSTVGVAALLDRGLGPRQAAWGMAGAAAFAALLWASAAGRVRQSLERKIQKPEGQSLEAVRDDEA